MHANFVTPGNMITFISLDVPVHVGRESISSSSILLWTAWQRLSHGYELYAPGGNPDVIGVGASEPFSLWGSLAVLRPMARVYLFFIIPLPLWWSHRCFLIMALIPNVAWQAHLAVGCVS